MKAINSAVTLRQGLPPGVESTEAAAFSLDVSGFKALSFSSKRNVSLTGVEKCGEDKTLNPKDCFRVGQPVGRTCWVSGTWALVFLRLGVFFPPV